jgi:predicted ATPase
MIKRLEIKDFKCFSRSSIDFNNLTVLVGINSVGKSSVIQSLLLCRQTYDKLRAFSADINTLKNVEVLLNNEYSLQLGNSSEVLNTMAGEENKLAFSLYGTDEKGIEFEYSVSKNFPELFLHFPNDKQIDNDYVNNLSIFRRQFHYLNTERVGPQNIQYMKNQEFPNTGYKGEYSGYAIAKAGDSKVLDKKRFLSSGGEFPTLQKQVDFWLDYILPGVQFRAEPYYNLNIVSLGLKRTSSGTEFLNPNNLGYGISYVLPIIVSGLLAEEGCMLIVENPELNLHPSAQSKIGLFLAQVASSGVQVIIETHSEHVINGIRIACLTEGLIHTDAVSFNSFSLDEDNRGICIENISLNKYAELSKWPKGFIDQEQNDLRMLNHLRKGLSK